MSHSRSFGNVAKNPGNNHSRVFKAAIKEAESFLDEALKAGLVDRYDVVLEEKLNYRIYTFKIAGPQSGVRYENKSLLSGTWCDVAKTEKGEIEPRKKLFDYYLRIIQTHETGVVKMELTVQGFSRHAERIGKVPAVELTQIDRRKTTPFFRSASNLMVGMKPIMDARAQKYIRKLDRLTRP